MKLKRNEKRIEDRFYLFLLLILTKKKDIIFYMALFSTCAEEDPEGWYLPDVSQSVSCLSHIPGSIPLSREPLKKGRGAAEAQTPQRIINNFPPRVRSPFFAVRRLQPLEVLPVEGQVNPYTQLEKERPRTNHLRNRLIEKIERAHRKLSPPVPHTPMAIDPKKDTDTDEEDDIDEEEASGVRPLSLNESFSQLNTSSGPQSALLRKDSGGFTSPRSRSKYTTTEEVLRSNLSEVFTQEERDQRYNKHHTLLAKLFIEATNRNLQREKADAFHRSQHANYRKNSQSPVKISDKLNYETYEDIRKVFKAYSPSLILCLSEMPQGGWIIAHVLINEAIFQKIDTGKTGKLSILDLLHFIYPSIKLPDLQRKVKIWNRNEAQRLQREILFGVKKISESEWHEAYDVGKINDAAVIFSHLDPEMKGAIRREDFVKWRVKTRIIYQEDLPRGSEDQEEFAAEQEFIAVSRGQTKLTFLHFLDFVNSYCY